MPLGDTTLGSAANLHLLGREVAGINVTQAALEGRLSKFTDPKLAWVYGFAFEGHYYDLPKPAIFVVDGPGHPIEQPLKDGLRSTGVPSEPPEFHSDVVAWCADREDLGIRLDIESGRYDRILLDVELGNNGRGHTVHGAHVRLQPAGAHVRLQSGGQNIIGSSLGRTD